MPALLLGAELFLSYVVIMGGTMGFVAAMDTNDSSEHRD